MRRVCVLGFRMSTNGTCILCSESVGVVGKVVETAREIYVFTFQRLIIICWHRVREGEREIIEE